MSTTTLSPDTAQHGIRAHSDGGYVPVQTRSARFASFDVAAFPPVTGREVDWKFAPLDRMSRLLSDEPTDDRTGDPAIDYVVEGAEGIRVGALAPGESPRGDALVPWDLPSAIASAQTAEALHLRIPAEVSLEEPVRVRIAGRGADRRANAHYVIEAMHHAKATVILEHTGSALLDENVEIIVREGANLEVVSVHEWQDDTVHAGAHQARVERDAFLKHTVVTLGGSIVRVNPSVHLAEQGAGAEVYGLYFADAGQHFEQQVYVNHDAPQTMSRVNYKGALQGEKAHTVWIGDVLIGQKAVGTDSYEQNRNLVLTEGTRADSIPNLEIETGDITGAGHASATGRFDDEQLFYLQARGIREDEARRLVVRGFLTEILQKIGSADLRARLEQAIEAELAGTPLTAGE